jgi:hypothetical protein
LAHPFSKSGAILMPTGDYRAELDAFAYSVCGRIQRHRQIVPESENLVILERNVRALREKRSPTADPVLKPSSICCLTTISMNCSAKRAIAR